MMLDKDELFLTYLKNNILYENTNFLILNKPFGLSVHNGSGVKLSVINLLRYSYIKSKKAVNLQLAHRLDKETSGCLILTKNNIFLLKVQKYFRLNKIKKIYHGIVFGIVLNNFVIDFPLFKKARLSEKVKKNAVTFIKPLRVLGANKQFTLIEIIPTTGKTHQIRVHLAYKDYPLLCDNKYGNYFLNKIFYNLGFKRLFLHARTINFCCSKQTHVINAPYDFFFKKILNYLSLL